MCDDIVVLCFCNFTGYRSHLGTSESTLYESNDKSKQYLFLWQAVASREAGGWVKMIRNIAIHNRANIWKMNWNFILYKENNKSKFLLIA
jgi:hypothetical protein